MPGAESGGYHNFWWSLDYGDIHFIMMSTEHDFSPLSEQYQFIEKVYFVINVVNCIFRI
jgi:hypothetical protein